MTPGRSSVLILGHGEMGRAMESLLGPRHAPAVWEKNLDDGSESEPLEVAAEARQFLLFAVPAGPHAELLARIAPRLPRDCICLSVAKGLDAEGRTPAAVLARALGDGHRFGLLYGPMIAEELAAGRPGFAEVATRYHAAFERIEALFAGSALQLRHSADVNGMSWCAVLKNVYVPLLGAAEGLELGDNTRGFLVTAVVEEMDRVVQAMGGRPGAAHGLAGLGDLVTTATSRGSHHRQVGIELARGVRAAKLTGEGLHSIAMIRRFGLIDTGEFPLLRLMFQIVDEPRETGTRLRAALGDWLAAARPARARD